MGGQKPWLKVYAQRSHKPGSCWLGLYTHWKGLAWTWSTLAWSYRWFLVGGLRWTGLGHGPAHTGGYLGTRCPGCDCGFYFGSFLGPCILGYRKKCYAVTCGLIGRTIRNRKSLWCFRLWSICSLVLYLYVSAPACANSKYQNTPG